MARGTSNRSRSGCSEPEPTRAGSGHHPRKVTPGSSFEGRALAGLAPAGAIAAGLLVWIALHENQPLARPSLKEVQIATKQAPPPPAPPVSTAAQAVSPSPNATLKKPQSAADEFAPANAGARRKP